ncbi:ankycorbin-like [Culicoides brevitarsis]|uniref:ankycorbin-like n=1 Tax=Culicoides brevitarsis TaxID=469753 RepID=UPI00307B45DA
MYACQNGLTKYVISELKNKPQSIYTKDRQSRSVLHYCSTPRNELGHVSRVMMKAPDLMEAEDEDGFTPLHLAIIQGNLPLVNLLLSQNANVDALDNEGHSVVHWAVVCGEIDALKACLNAGADISLADVNGASPLHFAAQLCGANYEGKSEKASFKLALEILHVILEHPSSMVDNVDKDGRTPLLWAASAGSEKAVLQLVKAGAKVESSDKDGLTALHCAASKGHTLVIDALVKLCGADVDLIDSNGCSALHYATTLGHADAVSILLDLGADPNRSDRKGRTPAHCGCNKGQLETIKILGSRKGNLWLRNARGDLPIHEACQSGRKELVQWLLEQKPIHVNTANNDGKTLLHIASSNDNVDLCKMLLDIGADANSIYRTPSNVVLTPLDVAVQKGHRNTAKFLQSNGGLPAQKLKITGKRPSLVLSAGSTDSDQIMKGKLVEKEEIYDIKKSKKYVVYSAKTTTLPKRKSKAQEIENESQDALLTVDKPSNQEPISSAENHETENNTEIWKEKQTDKEFSIKEVDTQAKLDDKDKKTEIEDETKSAEKSEQKKTDEKTNKKVEFDASTKHVESCVSADRSKLQNNLPKDAKHSFQVLDEIIKPVLENDVYQVSPEDDSGIEPSPKTIRSEKKNIKAEKRKPGDKYAVNMSTVTRSIQKNTKKYYMEKKIFQYLLELKGLQMRSNKSNEKLIIKRVIDDYHKAVGNEMPPYSYQEYTFKQFELFLYETLKSLQKRGSFNFQNLSEVHNDASVSDLLKSERALQCTTKTHRCLHALHSYTGIPCAAYIPLMNHHSIPKLGFGSLKTTAGRFLPKILSANSSNSNEQIESKKR